MLIVQTIENGEWENFRVRVGFIFHAKFGTTNVHQNSSIKTLPVAILTTVKNFQ